MVQGYVGITPDEVKNMVTYVWKWSSLNLVDGQLTCLCTLSWLELDNVVHYSVQVAALKIDISSSRTARQLGFSVLQ